MATYLDAILARHRAAARADERDPAALIESARSCPAPRGFAAAIRATTGLAVVAEVKRRSPSKGDLFADLDAAELARTYAVNGASCLSVLTDVEHFGGSVEDLVVAREASGLPVLRKDFTVCAADVCDARRWPSPCEVQVPLGANRTADARSELLLRMAHPISSRSPSVVAQSTNCGGSVMPFRRICCVHHCHLLPILVTLP